MKELSYSESTYHKSRAGTAYSVSKRLIENGLLQTVLQDVDTKENLVKVSESGEKALQQWLTPPLPQSDIAHSADLVRLRFFFLGVIHSEQRLALIDNTIGGLREFLARCEALIPANEQLGDYFGALATVSCILETKARLEWLTIVRDLVEKPISSEENWSETILKITRNWP
ncbi:MAG: hypothetical protein KF824_04895 [Fimbriimonadaceae bacterium]|nr:MAG: hypothetical protein KF824_04895 [Fimbriimonadaceae bacterium]